MSERDAAFIRYYSSILVCEFGEHTEFNLILTEKQSRDVGVTVKAKLLFLLTLLVNFYFGFRNFEMTCHQF